MIALDLSLVSAARARVADSPPPRTFDTIVIEGDSITSSSPSTYNDAFYSYRYQDARQDKTIIVRAQNSRSIGVSSYLNDDGNSLMGNVAEDMAYEPDLITVKIGTNGMGISLDRAAYHARAIDYYNAIKAERPECRVAWMIPLPINPDNRLAEYDTFMANRAALLTDIRDPAIWGQFADYYIPLGEHPDFTESPSLTPSLWGDTVHPSGFDDSSAAAGGQNRMFAVYQAAMDTLLDPARENSQALYDSAWPTSDIDLPVSTIVTRRYILSGLAHTGVAGDVSVTGSAVKVRVNSSGAFGSSGGMTHLYNGDVVDLEIATSALYQTAVSCDLTIGGETRTLTFTTAENVAPVNFVPGGAVTNPGNTNGGTMIHTGTFVEGVAFIVAYNETGVESVTVGGQPATLRLFTESSTSSHLRVYEVPVTAGDHEIVAQWSSGYSPRQVLVYGTIENGEFDTAAGYTQASHPGHLGTPHLTPAFTVPTNGLALSFIMEAGTDGSFTPFGAVAPGAIVLEGNTVFQSSVRGIAIAEQTEDGPAGFDAPWGKFPLGAVIYRTG